MKKEIVIFVHYCPVKVGLNNLKSSWGSSKGEQFLQKERNLLKFSEFL